LGQVVNTYLVNQIQARARINVDRITRRRRITDALIVMVALAFVAISFSLYLRTKEEVNSAKSRRQTLAEKVEFLTIESDRLERDVKALQTDPKAVEEYARHELGFVRPQDIIVKVEADAANPKSQ
jgi:cell division protein FtsB